MFEEPTGNRIGMLPVADGDGERTAALSDCGRGRSTEGWKPLRSVGRRMKPELRLQPH